LPIPTVPTRARSSLSNQPLARFAWPGFGALVAINVIWLVTTIVAPKPPVRTDEAYAECRAAVRRLRLEASRIPFPTADLIRVTRHDSVHHTVRGYYVAPSNTNQTRYTCEVSALPESRGWKVDTIVFQP
jgi:hypothetical protein